LIELLPASPGEEDPMTRCWPCVVVTMLCYLLAVAASAHADSAWVLWQQATVFTERWWIPKGWSSHWKAAELTPSDWRSSQPEAALPR
jgi:peptidoglycan/LPS O-acetylase OafA/YrhL